MVEANKLAAPFGAEVLGIDLKEGVTGMLMRELTSLLYEHRLLVIRGQEMEPGQYLEFGRQWGTPHPHVLDHARMPGFPELLEIGNVTERAKEEAFRNGAVLWHTDQSYETEPATATMSYCILAPEMGGETQLADQVAAYVALDEHMKTKIENMIVLHQYGAGPTGEDEQAASPIKTEKQSERLPVVPHPLVRRHPITGHRALYAVSGTSFGIEGLGPEEGAEFLQGLKEHSLSERFVYRHKYRVGDVAIWDTLSTMHSATPIEYATGISDRRLLYRISVKGAPGIYARAA
jgi:alpha-ketoglutarate-dependent taurine dioxygenase